jgi:HEAT repeat protein
VLREAALKHIVIERQMADWKQHSLNGQDPADVQGDLFAGCGWAATPPASAIVSLAMPAPNELDDAALAGAMAYASHSTCAALAAEVVERRVLAAVPALEDLCRRFKGFGRSQQVREQVIALETLAALGGTQASAAITRLIGERIVEGPGLRAALAAAAVVKARLPASTLSEALDDADPGLRALACRCARFCPNTIPRMIELLDDLHADVTNAAAVSLGQMGRRESMPVLLSMIRSAPVAETIDALASIADDDCFVELGRLAERQPNLRDAVCEALEGLDHPRAIIVLRRLERGRTHSQN